MDQDVDRMLVRLDMVKDIDPDNKTLLNDAHHTLQYVFEEMKRLRMHNNQLMNVIYQNQGIIEDGE
mgnify:CR=1 FL=1